jgi:hypothetical protein
MSDRLIEIARRIEAQRWNLPGTDKTWVLHALWEHHLLLTEMLRARRVDAH